MFGMACNFNPNQHKLMDFEALQWCKRQTTDPDIRAKLFAYHHLKEGTYVIGLWVTAPRRLFVDVMNLGGSPQNFNRTCAESFKQNLFAPTSAGQIKRDMQDEYSRHLHELNDISCNQSDRELRRTSTKVSVSFSGGIKNVSPNHKKPVEGNP